MHSSINMLIYVDIVATWQSDWYLAPLTSSRGVGNFDPPTQLPIPSGHLNKHDQTYTWFDVYFTTKTIGCGEKKIHTHVFCKVPGLDPQKKFP